MRLMSALIHAAALGELRLGETVLLAQLDELYGDVVSLLEDACAARAPSGASRARRSAVDLAVATGHRQTSSVQAQYGVSPSHVNAATTSLRGASTDAGAP